MESQIAQAKVRIEVHASDDGATELARDVRDGLAGDPKELPPKYFYDERGSRLFEQITRLPEYYPTRAERAILAEQGPQIVAAAGMPDSLVELGSGSAAKTRCLLDAMRDAGCLKRYLPVDISAEITRRTAERLLTEYPGLEVHGLICDFEQHLEKLPNGGRRMIAFLGGTIGNLHAPQRRAFLRRIGALMGPHDRLLLGTDLVKERSRLEAAYDDAAGVTAEFNKNVLHVLNRELGADFDPDCFEHRARYDPDRERVDIRLRSTSEQLVRLPAIDMQLELAHGEEIRTEISCKFTRPRLTRIYAEAGLQMTDWFTDPAGDFALSLARVAGQAGPS